MRALHRNQQLILSYLLSRKDGATLEELALHLGVTNTAAKEHIIKIEHLGYLTFKDTKGFVGRPRRRYLLSATGHEAFPRQYSWLSNMLLGLLAEDLGSTGVAKLMGQLGQRVAQSMADDLRSARSTTELLEKVNVAMNELGYQTTVRQTDLRKGAIIEATNCVYHTVAKKHPELCGFDTQFLESATGLKVKLESCIARGGSVCRFCLRKK